MPSNLPCVAAFKGLPTQSGGAASFREAEFLGLAVKPVTERKPAQFDAQSVGNEACGGGLPGPSRGEGLNWEAIDGGDREQPDQGPGGGSDLHPQSQHGAGLLPEVGGAPQSKTGI